MKTLGTLYRKIFYHWRAKYICSLGLHNPGGDAWYKRFVYKNYWSFCCMECGKNLITPYGKKQMKKI